MLRSLKRDESGIAMGLAIILIVLVGVMGAGLLVFVQRDLEAVVETNRGQDAFEAADAGVQAARRELLSNACPETYDGAEAGEEDEENACAGSEESEWSYASGFENAQGGKKLGFESSEDITVKIRYLPFHEDDDSCDDESLPEPVSEPRQHPNCAPEESEGEEDERRFFRVVSEGESASGNARRKIESIFFTYDLGVPKAYYSPEKVEIGGTADIDNVSIFSREDVSVSGDAEINGTDYAYGDWKNSYNKTARPDGEDRAGVGTTERITTGGVKGRDFDSNSEIPFVEEPSDGEMTFPFDPEAQSSEADEQRMQFWRDEADRQGNLYKRSGNTSLDEWPKNSTESTVVFVEFDETKSNNELNWNVDGGKYKCDEEGADEEAKKGTLVVEGADYDPGGRNQALFSGVVVIRGGNLSEGGDFDGSGNYCLDGFVNAEGKIDLNGTANSLTSQSVVNRPGFYGVETWSWRELYE